MVPSRWSLLGLVVLAGLSPAVAQARTPLPTIEVVQPERRVRLIDVRGPIQFGWGYSTLWRVPVYAFAFETQVSFVEITRSTWLHLTFGENVAVAPYPVREGERRPGLMGADLGLGLSRYAPGGPGVFVSASAGPRWLMGRDELTPDGVGVVARADIYPFFMTIKEIVATDRSQGRSRWFRKYVASGLHGWVSARWDHVRGQHGNAYAGGIGMDVGRTLLLPILQFARR